MNVDLKQRLERLQKALELNVEGLAKLLNVTRATLWNYQTGKRPPPPRFWGALERQERAANIPTPDDVVAQRCDLAGALAEEIGDTELQRQQAFERLVVNPVVVQLVDLKMDLQSALRRIALIEKNLRQTASKFTARDEGG